MNWTFNKFINFYMWHEITWNCDCHMWIQQSTVFTYELIFIYENKIKSHVNWSEVAIFTYEWKCPRINVCIYIYTHLFCVCVCVYINKCIYYITNIILLMFYIFLCLCGAGSQTIHWLLFILLYIYWTCLIYFYNYVVFYLLFFFLEDLLKYFGLKLNRLEQHVGNPTTIRPAPRPCWIRLSGAWQLIEL